MDSLELYFNNKEKEMTEGKNAGEVKTTAVKWINAGHHPRMGKMIKCPRCGLKIKHVTPRPESCPGCSTR